MEKQLFGPVILKRAEYYIKFYFPRTSCFSTGDDASKGGTALLDAIFVHLHFVERIFIDEVKSATAVHEHFGESKAIHDWTEDQCGWWSGCSEFSFVTGIEGNSRVTPWIYCCYVADFGHAVECLLAPII